MNRLQQALAGEPIAVPPIWLMRQAGRYHSHYQRLRASHSFETLCRNPELSAEVAIGPIRDFDFDAAILFSDLLFPLEALGMGLSYDAGPPKLDGVLTMERLGQFRPLAEARERLRFQAEAIAATRARLPRERGLIGFTGGPWTLFVYAVEGTHAGPLAHAKSSWDLYRRFDERMTPLLRDVVKMQLDAGADVVMILDTAAGELPPAQFHQDVAPSLTSIAAEFPSRVGYYAKASHPDLLSKTFVAAPWAGIGFDSRWDLASVFQNGRPSGFVQGNFDPAWLLLDPADLRRALDTFLLPLAALSPAARRGWICGLGHGVLPQTPEAAVHTFVRTVREVLA